MTTYKILRVIEDSINDFYRENKKDPESLFLGQKESAQVADYLNSKACYAPTSKRYNEITTKKFTGLITLFKVKLFSVDDESKMYLS